MVLDRILVVWKSDIHSLSRHLGEPLRISMPTIELSLLIEMSQVAQSAAQVNFGKSTFFLFCQAVKNAHLEVGLARPRAMRQYLYKLYVMILVWLVVLWTHPTTLRSLRLRGAFLSRIPKEPPGDLVPCVGKGSDIRHQSAQQGERDVSRKAPSLPRNTT